MKQHANKCASFKPKYHGDARNHLGDERLPCDCDGYHTFDELYEHRITLYIALCKELDDRFIPVWRSKKHSDDTSWDGWFLLGIGKDVGEQITYHLPNSKWEETNFAETLDTSPEFDGHTSDDVLRRLNNL